MSTPVLIRDMVIGKKYYLGEYKEKICLCIRDPHDFYKKAALYIEDINIHIKSWVGNISGEHDTSHFYPVKKEKGKFFIMIEGEDEFSSYYPSIDLVNKEAERLAYKYPNRVITIVDEKRRFWLVETKTSKLEEIK